MVDDGKLDPSSPFYLGAGDQPGNLITHVTLKGDNYLAWSRAITLSLKSRRKFGFVDGTISKPSDKKKTLDWKTVNTMLVSWILKSIDPKIAASIPYFEEATPLWNYLAKRFCESSRPRLQQLRASITNCHQSKDMSVEDYYTTLMAFFDDLLRLKPPHGCECGSCSCNVAAKYEANREEEWLHQFLVGIDHDKYAAVKTNLLSQQPPVTMDRAYQAFLQEERSQSIAHSKEKDVAHVFAVSSDRRSPKVDKSKFFCTHCKRMGHEATGCFWLHGYPDWWLEKYGKKGGSASSVQPAASRSPAAASFASVSTPTTPVSSRPAARAHAVGPSLGDTTSTPSSLPSDVLSALSKLSPEYVRALVTMVNNDTQERMSGESLLFSWILDTGASHHVTSDDTCLFDVHFINPCPVGLPDGATAVAMKEGSVCLADNIVLTNVLFIPNLACNLISVSQMITTSHCFVTFTNSMCAIQDQHSGSLIGAGELIDGLYFFRRVPKVCAVTDPKISTFELWHRRMGHPSDKIIKLVLALRDSSCSPFMNKPCEICPQAKQTRDSFPDSDSRASRIFEMIHCDFWGSYRTPSTCGAHYFLTIVDDFSRGVWVYLLNDKTEVYSSFCSFFAMVKCQFEVNVKYVRSDNGTEFKPMIPFSMRMVFFSKPLVSIHPSRMVVSSVNINIY
ncbi:Retrovirus-related Pol polyprotein from transposon TNT 1-94 [Bienertia sinuspersici]